MKYAKRKIAGNIDQIGLQYVWRILVWAFYDGNVTKIWPVLFTEWKKVSIQGMVPIKYACRFNSKREVDIFYS